MNKFKKIAALLSLTVFVAGAVAQSSEISLDDIVEGKYRAFSPAQMISMRDGSSYAELSQDGKAILRYEYATGKMLDTLFNAEATRGAKMDNIEGYVFNSQENKILLWQNAKPIYRRSYTADYYVYDCMHNLLEPLSENGAQRDASFSPDGRMVAFARDNNLYIKKLDFKTEVAVTNDGKKDSIINGVSDWLYEEEFMTTKMYEWSLDSKFLCFVKFNEAQVGAYVFPLYYCSIPEYEDYKYNPGEMHFKYPRAGQQNAKVSLYAYHIQYRRASKLTLPLEEEDYMPYLIGTKQNNQLAVLTLNRSQNQFKMYYINPQSNVSQLVLAESSETYVDPTYLTCIEFTSKDFTYLSEKDGYRHLYLYKKNGVLQKQLTQGEHEVINYYGRDTLKNLFYYQAVDEKPYQRAVYCSDKNGRQTKLSTQAGINKAIFSSQFNYYAASYSNISTPPVWTLYQSSGKALRVLQDNAALSAEWKALPHAEKTFFETPAADGKTLYGWMLKPLNMDETKKYPVMLIQYSGPDSQSALDEYDIDWEYFLANKGYIVVCVDGRGTGGRGEAFRKMTYLQLGKMETEDQMEVARALSTLPYVDASRIGIWGWSYGGYIALIAMTQPTSLFKAGVVIAPVTDYRYYNTAYTERFLRRPQENPAGYNDPSPLLHAADLKGNLLLVHGLADDNVHVNQSMELVDALVQAGKQFEMQFYPNRNHSILGDTYRKHLYHRWWNFVEKNL